jgi:hypothetical protein
MSCSNKKSGGGFKILLFGLLTGLVIGILFAPKAGTETIGRVSERVGGKLPV